MSKSNHVFDGKFLLKAGRYIVGDAEIISEKTTNDFKLKPIDSIFAFEFSEDKSILQCNLKNIKTDGKLFDQIEGIELPINSKHVVLCSADFIDGRKKMKNCHRFTVEKDFYISVLFEDDLVISCQIPKTPSPFHMFVTVYD